MTRVTFGRFGQLDDDGGSPAEIFLDGVTVGDIRRLVDVRYRGVAQRVRTVGGYILSLQGPLLELSEIAALDESTFGSLPELKRQIVTALGDLPQEVAQAYDLYWTRKITPQQWRERVLEACRRLVPNMKRYHLHGIAGLVVRVNNRITGLPMGLYVADQAGIESDPQTPWAAVCETHGSVLTTETQRLARAAMSYPEWCDECSHQLDPS